MRQNCPLSELDAMVDMAALLPWYGRVAALGHGKPELMSEQQAFDIARDASPLPVTHISPNGDPGGLQAGTEVSVTPDDNARVTVTGTLVAASDSEVVILRRDAQAGELHIHFPRLGYDLLAA
jgi:glutathione S-transferase